MSFICTFKHRLSVWFKFSVLTLLAFTLLACGGGGDGDTTPPNNPEPDPAKEAITLSYNNGNELKFQNTVSGINLGDSTTYPLTGNTGNGAVTFALLNNTANIGTVTPAGVFNPTADAEGSATLRVSVAATANYLAGYVDVPLLVTIKATQDASVLTFDQTPATKLMTDDTFTRAATKASAGVGDLSYRSSDEAVATVSNAGVVTFVSAGTTTITAQLTGNATTESISKKYQLTINKASQADLVYTGTQGAVNLFFTESISFTLAGGTGTGAFSASSIDDNVATISLNANSHSGTITPKTAGNVTITLTKAGDDDYEPISKEIAFNIANVAPVPSALVARQGYEEINLSWTSTANKFRVYQATETFASVDPANYSALPGNTSQEVTGVTQTTITGLTNGTTYYFVVTSVSADGNSESGISNEASITSAKLVAGTGKLNDSGITWGGTSLATNNTTCTSRHTREGVTINAPQDCDQGRDAQALANTLTKVGAGAAGFDFTKISSTGATLAADADDPWSCVLDNHTGLMWEAKSDDGLHGKNDTYTWYNTDATTNGGSAGTATHSSTPNTCEGYTVGSEGTYCNTQAFVARVNTQGLCGANDWRLPRVNELKSIVDYSRVNPAIDTNYFRHMPSERLWTSVPDVNRAQSAWFVSFIIGLPDQSTFSQSHRARLVRTGQ